MPGVFDSKVFNAEVFQQYIDRIPNLNRNELIRSRAIRPRPDLASAMSEEAGGNYLSTPLKGLIGGAAKNYDGATMLTANGTKTYLHSRIIIGRAAAWTERDFSHDITGGVDFIENVAEQISEYWEEVDQATIVHILNGIFKMSDTAGLEFIAKHSSNITTVQNSAGVTGKMDGTTLNTAMQKACGDNKSKFSLAIMHSMVATNLENLRLLEYLKYTDANGMQRDLAIGTLNGRTVLVDDNMPTETVETTAGVYEMTISTKATSGDKIKINGVTLIAGTDFSLSTDTATGNAAAIATALNASTDTSVSCYTWSSSSTKLTATEDSDHYGTGAFVATVTQGESGTMAVSAVTTATSPVVDTQYTTYVLGDGAIEYTDCGVKVPYEVDRDPKTNGGEDTLYSRQRKSFAPYGISFTKASMSSLSPTDNELEDGSNWEIVNDNSSSGKTYLNHKAIPIARIISLG